MSDPKITPDMTMEAILEAFPSAQRALFQRYHVGGCSSCAFQPSESLAEVCRDHNILDVNEVVAHLERAQEIDDEIQVPADQVRAWRAAGDDFRFLDLRNAEERGAGEVEGAEPLDFANSQQYMDQPKDTKLVFLCANGDRSLDVASYFIGHKFTSVFALRGGFEAWSGAADTAPTG